MRIKSKLIELFKRTISYNKNTSVYENGDSNDYPERIERLINNSVTAKQCANTMAVFLAGKGFGDNNSFEVSDGVTLLKLTHKASQSTSRQRGIFFHVNYNLNYEIASLDVLPFSHCRVGKKDDDKYNGKIGVCEDWTDHKKSGVKWINVYNSNKKVIKAQIDKCKGDTDVDKLDNYKGQVLFISLDNDTIYPYSTIDAVQNDCDSEAQASIYKNVSLRKGFFGKTIVITRPLLTAKPEDDDYKEQKDELTAFQGSMKDFMGAENADGILHLQLEFDDDEKIEKAIKFEKIETNINDKLFAFTENSVFNNILFAFNNLPKILARSSEGNMFGNSGELIKQAKIFYQDQTTMERMVVIDTIKMLMQKFSGFKGELTHEPLIKIEDAVS